MELTHRVTVGAPLDRVTAVLDDVAPVLACFPGAGLARHEGDRVEGALRVKLATLGLAFDGAGTYVTGTHGGRGVLVTGRGDDRRGHGAMAVTVRATLEGDQTRTVITVRTELALTGRAGQFGHGVIADAHARLFDQFADRLTARLAAGLIGAEPARVESHPVSTGAGPVGGGAQSGGASGVVNAPPPQVEPTEPTDPVRPPGATGDGAARQRSVGLALAGTLGLLALALATRALLTRALSRRRSLAG